MKTALIGTLVQDTHVAEDRARILKALGNPIRLRIVAHLCVTGEQPVGAICRDLDLPQAKVSQQITSLRLQGLVQLRKQGGFHYYSLAIPQLRELLSCLARSCHPEKIAS